MAHRGKAGLTVHIGYGKAQNGDYAFVYEDLYSHLASSSVKEGDYVKLGQFLGIEGGSGGNYAPHVHFGRKIQGKFTDPLEGMKNKSSIRLFKPMSPRCNN